MYESECVNVSCVNHLIKKSALYRKKTCVTDIGLWSCQINFSVGNIKITTYNNRLIFSQLLSIFEETVKKAHFIRNTFKFTCRLAVFIKYGSTTIWKITVKEVKLFKLKVNNSAFTFKLFIWQFKLNRQWL